MLYYATFVQTEGLSLSAHCYNNIGAFWHLAVNDLLFALDWFDSRAAGQGDVVAMEAVSDAWTVERWASATHFYIGHFEAMPPSPPPDRTLTVENCYWTEMHSGSTVSLRRRRIETHSQEGPKRLNPLFQPLAPLKWAFFRDSTSLNVMNMASNSPVIGPLKQGHAIGGRANGFDNAASL